MALSSYLLAPTQEQEVVDFCGEESPEECVYNASMAEAGGEEDLRGIATSTE